MHEVHESVQTCDLVCDMITAKGEQNNSKHQGLISGEALFCKTVIKNPARPENSSGANQNSFHQRPYNSGKCSMRVSQIM